MSKLLLSLVLIGSTQAIYDSLKSEAAMITQTNWMSQVVKGRQNDNIIILHFFKKDDKKSEAFSKDFSSKAEEYKGVFIFGYVNCDKEVALCKKENVTQWPTLRVYPPMPLPSEDIEFDIKKALGRAATFLKSYVSEVNADSVNGFVNTEVTLPKVLFFTDKPGVPLFIRALSKNFNKKLSFGVVRSEDKEVVKQYNIKKFPSLIVVKANQKKPNFFEKEMNYKSVFDFLNFFSEQFATVSGDKVSEQKPWLFDAIPELTDKSANEICLSLEKTLCVILFTTEKPGPEAMDVMKKLKSEFQNQLDRTASYKFMWINGKRNQKWSNELGVNELNEPTVRVFNPGRRKRYVVLEDKFSYQAVEKLLEKISGGDAKFVQLRGDVPAFTAEL